MGKVRVAGGGHYRLIEQWRRDEPGDGDVLRDGVVVGRLMNAATSTWFVTGSASDDAQ